MSSHVQAVLFDLLMAVMNSVAIWSSAAGDSRRGLEWRDAVTRKMAASSKYVPYEELVVDAAAEFGLPSETVSTLFERWREIEPWPDSVALSGLRLPFAFVTNCSTPLACVAAERAQATPRFVLSAEEAGWYKPDPRIYQEACGRLESSPESTLFVAGAAYDAHGASGAGLSAVLVARRADHLGRQTSIPIFASLHDVVSELSRTQ